MKGIDDNLRHLWDNIKHTKIWVKVVLEEEEKKKGSEKIFFKKLYLQTSPVWERKIVSQVQEVQSPLQDKPKKKHIKTHINQVNRD